MGSAEWPKGEGQCCEVAIGHASEQLQWVDRLHTVDGQDGLQGCHRDEWD